MQNNTYDNAFSNNKLPAQGYSNTLHDVAAVDPYLIAQQQRVMPRELKAGSQRGEMMIQGKLTVSDPNSDEKIVIGTVNDTFGIFGTSSDADNPDIAFSVVGQTFYFYNLNDSNHNIMQVGKLSDETFGWAVAAPGTDVADGL